MATKKTSTKATKAKNTKKKATKKSAAGKKEDRSDHRIDIQLLVDYKCDGNYLFDFCKDLGSGGVFIQTKKPLPSGSPIDLTFTIPDSKETVKIKGQVSWVQNEITERNDLTPGMGVQFSDFSGDQRKVLHDFVERYHGEEAPKVS